MGYKKLPIPIVNTALNIGAMHSGVTQSAYQSLLPAPNTIYFSEVEQLAVKCKILRGFKMPVEQKIG